MLGLERWPRVRRTGDLQHIARDAGVDPQVLILVAAEIDDALRRDPPLAVEDRDRLRVRQLRGVLHGPEP